jgi:DMSO reductase anchor subunit
MRPAFSVIFLTTLIGAAQGLFAALFLIELLSSSDAFPLRAAPAPRFYAGGAALAVLLAALGLIASFFHLGHPERAWRAVAMWRTSWLSRECLLLPLFMALVFAYGVAHACSLGGAALTLSIGVLASLACAALFVSTGMIYTCIRFLQEWASPLTTVNFACLGGASGFTLASAFAAWSAPGLSRFLAIGAILLTILGCAVRITTLRRNARLVSKSSLQSATGIRDKRIVQKSRGFTGGSFNTREFFHGQTEAMMRFVKWGFLCIAFALPLLLLATGIACRDTLAAVLLSAAFVVQYLGLLAERWFFFAQANHPQNLYYQGVS